MLVFLAEELCTAQSCAPKKRAASEQRPRKGHATSIRTPLEGLSSTSLPKHHLESGLGGGCLQTGQAG